VNSLEKELSSWIKNQGSMDFPGGKILCYHQGKKKVDLSYGKVWPLYDLASLTKILFTTSVIMELVQSKKLNLSEKVQTYYPWYSGKSVKISQLLNHTAGNTAWLPLYKKVNQKSEVSLRLPQLMGQLRGLPRSRKSEAVYSDLDFFILGGVLEQIMDRPLVEIWSDFKDRVLPKTKLHFTPKKQSRFSKSHYAPTEPCVWRKRPLQGEVHDENCFALGGVAPHAGLFGGIDDLGAYALLLRSILRGKKGFVTQSLLKKFTKASIPQKHGFWGLGFMKPSLEGSTAGQNFSSSSFGHTGFTGTSLWMDPKRDLIVALVSNRVYPSRKNKDFQRIRPLIHDWIGERI